ncbi:unnamed protein product [Gemmata massiliana]|uniref:Uncharacterized protein n=1 Tax=Gemmata massiliana TaxID=1210884 RepID=A0A6P2CQR2_9BACT|nr:unnamed protein product [Gemmata massiliana]
MRRGRPLKIKEYQVEDTERAEVHKGRAARTDPTWVSSERLPVGTFSWRMKTADLEVRLRAANGPVISHYGADVRGEFFPHNVPAVLLERGPIREPTPHGECFFLFDVK